MVPPPGSTGNDFPDFDKMTLEEQMAWLESLARRQGASEEEFTTAANLDIPELPPDTVVDEPGYVPFDPVTGGRKAEAAPPPPLPVQPPVEEPPMLMEEPLPELDFGSGEPGLEEAADPMQWLESLSAHSAEPSEDLFADLGLQEISDFQETFTPENADASTFDFDSMFETPQVDEPAPATVADDDPLGGMDPMLWLESLAKRQGAKTEELLTDANAEVQEVSPDVVIDEPGYIPYDAATGGRKAETPPPPSQPEFIEPPMPEISEEPIVSEMMSEATPADGDDPLGGMDPMRWLESLAKRQGAKTEELTTSADLDIPELPPDTVVDEPGYVEYSAFSDYGRDDEPSRSQRDEVPPPPISMPEPEFAQSVEEIPSDFEAMDGSLSWLEDLAAESSSEASDFLAFGDNFAAVEEAEAEIAAPVSVDPNDPLAGMTDEEIAYAQAHGMLSGAQEFAWLQRQARKLAETRHIEAEEFFAQEDVEPAEPGEVPPWIQQIREQQAEVSPLMEDLPPAEPAILPDWLSESAPAQADQPELSFDSDVDSLWAETAEEQVFAEAEPISQSELDAYLQGDFLSDAPDQLAEALDEEFDRKLAGDQTEPEWYTSALTQTTGSTEAAPEPVSAPPEPVLAEAAPVDDMPDWLKEQVEEEVAPTVDSDMPKWLTEKAEAEIPAAAAMPDWLMEESPAVPADNTDWFTQLAQEPEPEPAKPESAPQFVPPQTPVAPPEPEPIAAPAKPPVPESALFAQYRQRLDADPNDHPTRLALARALRTQKELVWSMDQYEALIDVAQLLQDVAQDLTSMVAENADVPRLRRLLGDVYMRQGMLQKALDAYRSALDQL